MNYQEILSTMNYQEILSTLNPEAHIQTSRPSYFNDRTNEQHGRLVVLAPTTIRMSSQVVWLCQCTCGNYCLVASGNLREGNSCGCNFRLPPGEGSLRSLERKYKQRAARRGFDWSLTRDQFRAITQLPCYYCDSLPATTHVNPGANGPYIHNGIDRVDSTKGYMPGNIVPCCKTCNYAKRKMSADGFLAWIERVYIFSVQKNKK